MKQEIIMKVGIVLILVVVLIGGCFLTYNLTTKKEVIEVKNYNVDNLKFDADLVTQPLMSSLVKGLSKKNDLEIQFASKGIVGLIEKESDILITSKLTEAELAYLEEKNADVKLFPIVNDAFVFYVHKNNKVENLSLTQIQSIYSGVITNWSKVGGSSSEIQAFQHLVSTPSQKQMLELMDGFEMIPPITVNYKTGSEVDILNGEADAITYSNYYYAKSNYGDRINFIGLNGIAANYENIRNETYPYIHTYYVAIRADETNETIKEMVSEMVAERGKIIARTNGYIPVK